MLLEEVPTDWTEEELIECKDREKFASFRISRLFDSDFGRKTRISTIGPPPAAATSSVSPALTSESTVIAYPAPPALASINASTILPSITTFVPAPTPPTNAGSTPAVKPIMNPASSVPSPAMTTASTGHGRELSNLAEIYTDKAKHRGQNGSYPLKPAILHEICARAVVPPEAKMKVFPPMLKGLALEFYYSNIRNSGFAMKFNQLFYSIKARLRTGKMRYDKSLDEIGQDSG